MAKKFEIIGSALVITDTDTSNVVFDEPKSKYYYKSKDLKEGNIVIYNLSVEDQVVKNLPPIRLTDAQQNGVPFTKETFTSFCRENLGS